MPETSDSGTETATARKLTLLEQADYLTKGAERARLDGDLQAMAVLLVAASQRITLHKLLEGRE